MSNVIAFRRPNAEPTRGHDAGLLRVIRALERSGIAVVAPDECEDAAIERAVRNVLPVSPELERLASSTRTEAEARAERARAAMLQVFA